MSAAIYCNHDTTKVRVCTVPSHGHVSAAVSPLVLTLRASGLLDGYQLQATQGTPVSAVMLRINVLGLRA